MRTNEAGRTDVGGDICAVWVTRVCSCDLWQRSNECENQRAVCLRGRGTGRGVRVAVSHVCGHWTCAFIDSRWISEDHDVLFVKCKTGPGCRLHLLGLRPLGLLDVYYGID